MSDISKIISHFNKRYPKLIVTMVVDYDAVHYVVEAVENLSRINYDDPFYGIEKRTGQISYFSPSGDIDKFMDAVEKRTIYRRVK